MRFPELIVLTTDAALQCAGALLLLAPLAEWRRTRWRDPLANGLPWKPAVGPHDALLVVCAFILASTLANMLIRLDPRESAEPGAHGWHLRQAVDMVIKLALCAVMAKWLWRAPARGAVRAAIGRVLGIGAATALVAGAICYAQLRATQTLWVWLLPETPAPVHASLRAITASDWGVWGVVEVVFAASLVAPLAEELFFRGVVLEATLKSTGSVWLAALVSAVTFGAIHSQPQDILPLVSLGLILAYVRVRYRSLAACVAAHAIFNLRTLSFALLDPHAAAA
jgi:membrane protease YdiL (CAAX protease family)